MFCVALLTHTLSSASCINCGAVVAQNTLSAEIAFGESSSGAAIVQGSYVANNASESEECLRWGVEPRPLLIRFRTLQPERRCLDPELVTSTSKVEKQRCRMVCAFRWPSIAEADICTTLTGRRAIQNLAFTMSISTTLADNAARWYNLAVANDFTKGRKANYVIAACLYVACRKNKHPAMLIDFSDKLRVRYTPVVCPNKVFAINLYDFHQVNVFELGSTYLKLVRKLNIPDIPLIDPSIYISRFAALLEFGDDTQRVAHDAARLASRFERDWMQTGRRPSGICGACLILAARMNNFRRSIAEIVQVVKIADVTLKKRLQEFQATKSGSLTVDEFRKVWLQEEDKPPAMLKNEQKERERIKALAAAAEAAARGEGSDESEDEDDSASKNPKKRKLTSKEMLAEKRQRMRSGDSATPMRGSSLAPLTPSRKFLPSPSPFDRGEASMSPGAAFASFQGELNRLETVDGQASGSSPAPAAQAASTEQDILDRLAAVRSGEDGDETDLLEQQANGKEKTDELDLPLVDEAVTGEILDYMAQQKPASLAEELELAEQRRLRDLEDRIAAQGDEDELKGLDEDELDAYLLDERQIAAKTIIWNKFNHEYMVKLNGESRGCTPTRLRANVIAVPQSAMLRRPEKRSHRRR